MHKQGLHGYIKPGQKTADHVIYQVSENKSVWSNVNTAKKTRMTCSLN